MARNLLTSGIVPQPLIGGRAALAYRDTQLGMPRTQKSRTVPVSIDWAAYGASSTNQKVAVSISLIGGTQASGLLDCIRTVYIDNTFSKVTIYVFFDDINYTVVCPPGAIVCQPVMTNSNTAYVYAEGFVDGQIPLTELQFMNFEVAGFYIPTDAGLAPKLDFLSFQSTATNTATPTFINIPAGAAAADRLIIVGMLVSNQTVTGITLDGVAMNAAVNAPLGGAGTVPCSIWYLRVPLGTIIGALAVTLPGVSIAGVGLGVWRMINQDSDIPYTSQFLSDGGTATKAVSDTYVGQSAGIYAASTVPVAPNVIGATVNAQAIFGKTGVSDCVATFAQHSSLVTENRTISIVPPSGTARSIASAVWT